MRILFSSTPAHGHLLPQLPLARAFRDRGDDVAVMTAGAFAPVLAPEGIELLGVGPTADVLFAETARRTGADAATDPTPETVAEFFAGTRVDLTADEALAAARAFRPDLVVAEACDAVGPLAAAALGVPYATLAFGPAIPAPFTDGLTAVAASRYADRGLTQGQARWYLDPCPDAIQAPGRRPPHGRLALRPEPHQGPAGAPAVTDTAPAPGGRARVLVTFGTHFAEPRVLGPILTALSASGADLRVTLGLTASADDYDVDRERVTFAPFTPLAELLHGIDLVVTHGGAGTTLGALARGLPLVVVPQGADQFLQAAGVAASRTGIAVEPGAATPEAVARAAAEVLADAQYADNARKAADQISAMPAPAEVADTLAAALR
ncbi:glycosyltransferase [Streptomyces sp. NRRL F-5126]|uniref:glycosyltransferase n=1 Tax=Streptomyces sp. NRRL F-5126 TaxID=1463857 RepID=UPI0004C5B624|nr:glycosyltransferase [Streptomyces sp. NRRL F-5126]